MVNIMDKSNQPTCEIDWHGNKRWYLNGRRHREDGPAIESSNGYKGWFLHGQYHRETGPAIEYIDGSKSWYHYDKLHRLDGPATEYADGRKEWWFYGKYINCSSQEEFERLIKLRALW